MKLIVGDYYNLESMDSVARITKRTDTEVFYVYESTSSPEYSLRIPLFIEAFRPLPAYGTPLWKVLNG